MSEDTYDDSEDMEYSETSAADEYSVNENTNNSENDDNQSSISEGVIIDENNENNNSESQLNQEEPKWQSQFVGNGFDCTCYGSCLCKRYKPKSPYDTDCFYCGHHLNDHTPR